MKKTKIWIAAVLAGLSVISLVACAPRTVEKANEKMRLEGYTVIKTTENAQGFVDGISAEKTDDGQIEKLVALLFDSKKNAKAYYESVKNSTNALLDGKWVYYGTEDGIDDFLD